MDKRTFLLILTLFFYNSYGQEYNKDLPENLSELFSDNEIMCISLKYSNKDIKKETNDSTFITTNLKYKNPSNTWDSLEVRLRKRGHFRFDNCYFAPIKVKIKKKEANKTLFEGHKNLKLVLPCLIQRDNNDNIVKEYLAYKLYEIVSPYHFKSKLVQVTYEEIKGKNIKTHEIKGIFIEDDKHVAKRIGGKVLKSNIHPLNHTPLESVRNSFFQYMIGNTDFSNAYLHNTKLIFLENQIIPVPYDFDMAGMVNTSYATVSNINGEPLNEYGKVTDRVYRGFQRDPEFFTEVRLEFLGNRLAILGAIQECKPLFENESEYDSTLEYIEEFFVIIANDKKYEKEILNEARTK